MNYTAFLIELVKTIGKTDGERLAYLLSATGPGVTELRKDLKETSVRQLGRSSQREP